MSDPVQPEQQPRAWFLEAVADDEQRVLRTRIHASPWLVGRWSGCSLRLASPRVSSRHAELRLEDQRVVLVDLGSTNGSFVNGERIRKQRLLQVGDLVHFADQEFRLVQLREGQRYASTQMIDPGEVLGPMLRAARNEALQEMLKRGDVTSAFQPIVRSLDHAVVGYEALGRGASGLLEGAPKELFVLAGALGLELELSRLFRELALEQAALLPGNPMIFLNTHPQEIRHGEGLLADLRTVLDRQPGLRLVVELHEAAAPSPSALREICAAIHELGAALAFDDFGAGQSRFFELAELEPNFVKFDALLIRGLEAAPERRREMVRSLLSIVHTMGAQSIAEGVESEAESTACHELGFEHLQGFYFSRPAPASSFSV